jgi:hypothetical protein
VAIADGDDPEDAVVLYPSLGTTRVWYHNMPDGRTTFSNGLINGIVNAGGASRTTWGVPVPAEVGTITPVGGGGLYAGTFRAAATYVRTADGLEGGQVLSSTFELTEGQGIVITGLPTLAGHSINIYLSGHNGAKLRLAGNAAGATFTFTGDANDLQRPLMTENVRPAPVGTLSAYWRGRALVAAGNVLFASKHMRPEHFVLGDAFKVFASDITLVQPVDAGIFVGTEGGELTFLAGTEWAKLAPTVVQRGSVVLGSGVTVPGKHLVRGDGTAGSGDCMVCICDGAILAGYQDGAVAALTKGRYETDVTEVAATFRMRDGEIPQYIAVPQ